MHTQPQTTAEPTARQTEETRATSSTSYALRNAQRTFDPFNTAECPRMFEDKWTAEE